MFAKQPISYSIAEFWRTLAAQCTTNESFSKILARAVFDTAVRCVPSGLDLYEGGTHFGEVAAGAHWLRVRRVNRSVEDDAVEAVDSFNSERSCEHGPSVSWEVSICITTQLEQLHRVALCSQWRQGCLCSPALAPQPLVGCYAAIARGRSAQVDECDVGAAVAAGQSRHECGHGRGRAATVPPPAIASRWLAEQQHLGRGLEFALRGRQQVLSTWPDPCAAPQLSIGRTELPLEAAAACIGT